MSQTSDSTSADADEHDPTAPETRAGRVALVGRPNVGKSTLLNALVGEPIAIRSPHPQTTRDAVRGVVTRGDTQYVLVDTPGLHAPRTRLGQTMNDVAWRHVRAADAVVFVAEASAGEPRPTDLALAAELPDAPTVLALNKVDRVGDKAALLPAIEAFAKARAFRAIVPLSATREGGGDEASAAHALRAGSGPARLLDELRPLLPVQPLLFPPDTLSDQPERFFTAELIREQVLQHLRQEVPHGVAVVIERFDDQTRPPRIEATVYVARDAHVKIVVGAGARMLKSIGVAARARIERLLGGRVHLQLQVRSAPDWMNDDARLREFGYGPQEDE